MSLLCLRGCCWGCPRTCPSTSLLSCAAGHFVWLSFWNFSSRLLTYCVEKEGYACCVATQGGITCGAIDEPRKSSKAIDERVIINFRDKNVVIARKSRQMQFQDKTAYVWMGILLLKKRVNRDICSFATKQRMFGVFAIDEILRYRGTRFPGSRTLCHPGSE